MKTLQELLDIILSNTKVNDAYSFYSKKSWEMIMQKTFSNNNTNAQEIADHSKVVNMENNTLTIQVDHPGWIQLLQTKKNEIIAIIKEEFPDMGISTLDFSIAK